MLLANPDRLPCSRLMWRGNPGNLLYGRAGPGDGDGAAAKGGEKSVVVIDQAVPVDLPRCEPGRTPRRSRR